jgi:L-malate glycosyltransferase
LHCLETVGSGGVEQRRLSLGKYLDKEKFEQYLVCSKIKPELREKFANLKIKCFAIGEMRHLFNSSYFVRLIKVVRSVKPDIIHGAVFEGVTSAVVAGLICRIKIIIIEETSEPINRTWRGNLLFKVLALFSQTIIATSPAVYSYLTDFLKLSKSKVRLIMNGVDPKSMPDNADVFRLRQDLALAENDFVIGSVGRMIDRVKQFSLLIKAFKIFSESAKDVKLLLVGDGPDRLFLEQLAVDLQMQDNIIFVGYQSDTQIFYELMDIFALVSSTEGFGIAAVEAMFTGLPVISSNVGGLPSIVVHEETGFIIDPISPQVVSRGIGDLYKNRALCKRMGEAGKARAYKVFHAQRYAQDVESVYKEVLSK